MGKVFTSSPPFPARDTGPSAGAALQPAAAPRAGWAHPIQTLLTLLGRSFVREDPLERADAIVVLAGDSALGGRVQQAAEFYWEGWAAQLIASGPPLFAGFNEADLVLHQARRLGVPPTALSALRHRATSTLEEAEVLLPFLAANGFHRVIVVSSNFHTRRARAIYRALLRCHRYPVEVVVRAAPDARFAPDKWWKARLGVVTTGLEALKNVLTWLELIRLPARANGAGATADFRSYPEIEEPASLRREQPVH